MVLWGDLWYHYRAARGKLPGLKYTSVDNLNCRTGPSVVPYPVPIQELCPAQLAEPDSWRVHALP